ncbi:MAG: phosphate acetyltransferase [Bacteroidetes bacterium HGW-Bacteroidetes-22]|nr:MAG: phosphate acetyltransferase [Bacteroidetes bacterium HGW-Bacteroidetes-22]
MKQDAPRRIAVAAAEDANTLGAVVRAVNDGFAEAILIGDRRAIEQTASAAGIHINPAWIVDAGDHACAVACAVQMVRTGKADVLMKGLVNTDLFLKAVLNTETGLLPKGRVMSYVCAVEVPDYPKLMFITDTAVLPFPDLNQKEAMLRYALSMARRFGIAEPKVALIGASEKVSPNFPNSIDYALLSKMAERGQFGKCLVDGPLDIFLACDPASAAIKGVPTPIAGQADVLLFPSLEACNAFYKGLMLFAGGELAGMICGPDKPVVVMSRSESENSKYYCIALSCLMADE